jgi:lysine 2,3-aminomutase
LVNLFHSDTYSVQFVTGVANDQSASLYLEHKVTEKQTYTPTDRERSFLETVEDTRHEREIVNGLAPFFNERVPEDMLSFYSKDEVVSLRVLKGTDRDVEQRMPVKITRHYFELARNSKAIQRIVKPSADETTDMAGSEDPGNQMDYSPVEGLLHKYEMGLMYVVSTCSAHCRFCYREELIARKEVERHDGTVAKKGLAKIPEIMSYIRAHNELVKANGGIHPETGREKLREILLSGGDPMVLNNSKIAAWLSSLAESGVESIRIGTKEMAFYPQRFDDAFLSMLDRFHETYPQVALHFMLHFEHPDEILAKHEDGNYIQDAQGFYQWVPETGEAMRNLVSRGWVSVQNQTPIIKDINDDVQALRTLQREFKRAGGENHYFFCGRDIVAYKAFNVPIETAWMKLNESQRGLSGIESHARLSITHYKGKTEVNAVTNEPIPGLAGSENGVVIFKLLRNAHSAPDRGKVCIVGRNPDAVWFDDYEDRVLFDEAGLFDYKRLAESGEAPVNIASSIPRKDGCG